MAGKKGTSGSGGYRVGAGRPPVHGRARTERLTLRLTHTELHDLRRFAAEDGVRPAEWAYRRLHKVLTDELFWRGAGDQQAP